METKTSLPFIMLLLLLLDVVSVPPPFAAAYTNHTVGGAAGWFFNADTGTPSAKYSDWAANQTFSLGDFLIFSTSTNQSVIQTYNRTTYHDCSIDDSEDDDTFSFSGGNNAFNQSVTIVVPLTIEGVNYYFSDSDDGLQCQQGMAFEIDVKHGSGLPPSLNQPPPPAYVEPGPPTSNDDTQSPPVTILTTPPPSIGIRVGIADMHWVIGFVMLCGAMLVME